MPAMKHFTLDEIYADARRKRAMKNADEAAHRTIVQRALVPGEPVLLYWWDGGVSGLVLATDRRLLHFPRLEKRKALFGFTVSFERESYPYHTIQGVSHTLGSTWQHPLIHLHRDGADDALLVITQLKNPQVEARTVELQKLIATCKSTDIATTAVVDAVDPALTDVALAEQLQHLFDLYKDGALDRAEFEAAKQKLLAAQDK